MPAQKSLLDKPDDRLVINTGPLIALTRIDALEIVLQLPLNLMCPEQVRQELEIGTKRGLPFAFPDGLTVVSLERPLEMVASVTLDAGEAAVIQLAIEKDIQTVCIDERRGRQVATAVGLNVVGTLGLLLRAKTEGIIDAVRPFVLRLLAAGIWYDQKLIARVLESTGEDL